MQTPNSAAILNGFLMAGTFINIYTNVDRMLEFASAALESIPGVATCRFFVPDSESEGQVDRPVRRGVGGDVDSGSRSDYDVMLETGNGYYGQVVLEIHDRGQFREFEAAVRNFLGSLATRLENVEYQSHLEKHVREQTAEINANHLFLRSILDNTGDVVFVIDREFTIVEANKAAFELSRRNGGPIDTLAGAKCYSAYYQKGSPCEGCPSLSAMQSGNQRRRTVSYADGTSDTRWFDVFSFPILDNTGTVINVIESWRDIGELKALQDTLQQTVKEKEVLLREMHHRVKNSLYSVMALLRLQFSAFADERVQNAFNASIDRIKSTALVHEFLYKADSLDSIDFRTYVERVVQELTRTHDRSGQIEFKIDIRDLGVSADDAVPISLIVTEVITNALKYAFPDGRPGCITVSTRVLDADTAELEVQDNGIGLPEGLDLATTDSLGMQLLQAFTSQVNGTMELTGTNGTCFRLRFPRHGRRA